MHQFKSIFSFLVDIGNQTTKSLSQARIPPLFFSVGVLLAPKQPRTLSAGQVTFKLHLASFNRLRAA